MTQALAIATPRGARQWLRWSGALLGLLALAWILRGFDLVRFRDILARADPRWLAVVPLAVIAEQVLRAWKWRQLLLPLRTVGVLRLFGTIMAGYLLAILIPLGVGTVARSWLVARREGLKLTSVLATVALDRLTDGVVFACLVPMALWSVVFDDPTGGIRAGLVWGGAGSFLLFSAVLLALAAGKRGALNPDRRIARWAARMPPRFLPAIRRHAAGFAEGIAWPSGRWRGIGIVLASVAIKVVAASHLMWAGFAVGISLAPAQYLFLVVFLGFIAILGHFLRFIGSFVIGGVFALGLFGVAAEPALAMLLIVETASLLSVAIVGSLSLWRQGVALADLRGAHVSDERAAG